VEMSLLSVQTALRLRIAVPNASEMPVRPVAAVIVLTFIGVVRHPHLNLPLFKTFASGVTRDASGEHIRFVLLFGSGPVTNMCVSQTATRLTIGFWPIEHMSQAVQS